MLFMQNVCICLQPNQSFISNTLIITKRQKSIQHAVFSCSMHTDTQLQSHTHSSSCLTLNFRMLEALNLLHDLVKTGHVMWGSKQAS